MGRQIEWGRGVNQDLRPTTPRSRQNAGEVIGSLVPRPASKAEAGFDAAQQLTIPGLGRAQGVKPVEAIPSRAGESRQLPLFKTTRIMDNSDTEYYHPHGGDLDAPTEEKLTGTDILQRFDKGRADYIQKYGELSGDHPEARSEFGDAVTGGEDAWGRGHHWKYDWDDAVGTHEAHVDNANSLRSGALGWGGPADASKIQHNKGLQFSDLRHDESLWDVGWGDETEVYLGPGDDAENPRPFPVAGVQHSSSDWGTDVNYAEVSPAFKGRGFSRDAMTNFVDYKMDEEHYEGGPSLVHAGSFTSDGHRAFGMKGIPTHSDLSDLASEKADERFDQLVMEDDRETLRDEFGISDEMLGWSDDDQDWSNPITEGIDRRDSGYGHRQAGLDTARGEVREEVSGAMRSALSELSRPPGAPTDAATKWWDSYSKRTGGPTSPVTKYSRGAPPRRGEQLSMVEKS